MKKKTHKPTASKLVVLRQICNLIPTHLVAKIAKETGAAERSRTYSPWSHVVTMLHAQLTHSVGLNDTCDGLQLHSGRLSSIRGATPPERNTLSHANKVRPAAMAQQLFWQVRKHLEAQTPGFGRRRGRPRLKRFRATISILDSTVIELVANSLDWAKHRRRKAAAKCHVRMDLESWLPHCVVVDTARESDTGRARELTAALKSGEIVVFDRGYIDLKHFKDLNDRKVFWVTRIKEGMKYDLLESYAVKGDILEDQRIMLNDGVEARRVRAIVEVDGERREMVFLTNNLKWAASTVCDLYASRWDIELFFKQMKQTLKLSDFLGNSANAVRWQVWMALLTYLLLRWHAWASQWSGSFIRLWALIRSAIWTKWDLVALLKSYGTAGGGLRLLGQPEALYLPGFG